MVLFNVAITIQLFYLVGLLFVLYEGLKGLEYVNNKYILLLVISIGINFIFYGISIKTLFVSVTALSFVVLIKEMCKVLRH